MVTLGPLVSHTWEARGSDTARRTRQAGETNISLSSREAWAAGKTRKTGVSFGTCTATTEGHLERLVEMTGRERLVIIVDVK